jgi:hypothetical protein
LSRKLRPSARLSFNANIQVNRSGTPCEEKDLKNNDGKNLQRKREDRLLLMFTFASLEAMIISMRFHTGKPHCQSRRRLPQFPSHGMATMQNK